MTDIILYQGETSPSDVKLRGPTAVPRSTSIVVPVIDNGTAPTGPVVYYQSRFEPLPPIAAAIAYTVLYLQPLSGAPPVAQARLGNSFVPFNTFQVNTQTIDKWQSPLSIPLPVAKALPGNSFVPFDTFQINTQRIDKWLVPLSKPVPVAKAQQGNAFVPLNTFQINTQTIDKWQQPLSIPIPAAIAQQGNSFVPFDTTQTNTQRIDKWLVPLSIAVPVAKAQLGNNFVPFDTRQTNTATLDKWQVPLSVAAKVAIAQQGNSFLPFNTTQPQDIEGMAWWIPLGVVPFSVVYAPQQYVVEPPQFGEIATSSTDATDPLGDYSLIPLYRRKKLEDELLEIELKLRDIAIDIPLPGHSDPVIYNRPLLEPFSDKQQTIKVLVSRRAEAQAEYQKLLKAQQDEDDDDAAILLLWP